MNRPSDHPVRHKVITQIICVVLFIIVPVLVTAMLPTSWISLKRDKEDRVSATARTCVLFVIPWRTQQVADVSRVESHTLHSDRSETRRYLNSSRPDKGTTHVDGVDELTVKGKDGTLAVSISPASTARVKGNVQAFLLDHSQRETRLFVTANWKFCLSFGLPLTLLTLLYIGGSTVAVARTLIRKAPSR
jgi:hypothetical protein